MHYGVAFGVATVFYLIVSRVPVLLKYPLIVGPIYGVIVYFMMAYVIVPLTTGTLRIVDGKGESSLADLTAGQTYFRKAGVEHDVQNANDFEFAFVEVEIK